jgi:hypothetical protein
MAIAPDEKALCYIIFAEHPEWFPNPIGWLLDEDDALLNWPRPL